MPKIPKKVTATRSESEASETEALTTEAPSLASVWSGCEAATLDDVKRARAECLATRLLSDREVVARIRALKGLFGYKQPSRDNDPLYSYQRQLLDTVLFGWLIKKYQRSRAQRRKS